MNVVVVGGGPGGLYAALLMKRRDPRAQITVIERHRPDDTFGWGVVFSDQTLGTLAAAALRLFDGSAELSIPPDLKPVLHEAKMLKSSFA